MTYLAWAVISIVSLSGAYLVWVLLGGQRQEHQRALLNLQRGLTVARGSRDEKTQRPLVIAGVSQSRLWRPTTRYLERLIAKAGFPEKWPIDRIISAKMLLTTVAAVLGLLIAATARTGEAIGLALFITVLCFFLPDVRLYSMAQERAKAISLSLPDMLDQMSIAVEAGLGFDMAMIRVARNSKGPLARELIRAMNDIQAGVTRRAAYEDLGDRCDVPELRRFLRAVIQGEAYGLAQATVLETQAAEMRTRRRQRAEQKAMEIPVKVIFPLVLFILPALFIVLVGPAAIGIMEAFRNV